ncbi:MAG: hypothetical protein IPJ25_13710 [Rhodocyclaceae bacterium]|nr:hypothetical protein [Rhodocyclaceae bacterium]
MVKLRSMIRTWPSLASIDMANDRRITPVGHFIPPLQARRVHAAWNVQG